MEQDLKLQYGNMALPENVDDILSSDFWIYDQLNAAILNWVQDPVKFTSTVSIFVRKGSCRGEVNLISYEMEAPCLFNIQPGQILQSISVSDDFEASFTVMSHRLAEGIFGCLHGVETFQAARTGTVVSLAPDMSEELVRFYNDMSAIAADLSNPYRLQAFLYTTVSFFFRYGSRLYPDPAESLRSHLTDEFMALAGKHFRQERFLDFYAEKLGVSVRHMSRIIKNSTGKTAGEWIDKMVILEAKVLLKSSTLTINQIADELNFPSASFFCKYFKSKVGVTPRGYRYPAV